jgi:hypothetical protein
MFTSPKIRLPRLLKRGLSMAIVASVLAAATGADARVEKMPEQQRDLAEFVVGNMLFVGFHELGHALVGQLHLPVLGRAEAAADSFATLALLEEGTEFSVNVLVQAARGWFLMDRRDRKLGRKLDFYDAHGLDQQRAFQIVCLMVGSDQKKFKKLADWVHLPQDRQQSCRDDYDNAKYSWDLVLKPHRRSADQPNSTVEAVHKEGGGKLDAFARSFRSIGFLDTLAEHVSSRYVLPRPITLEMKSCGDANAWWDPPTLKETLCYEMAEDFAELYRGYTEKAAPQKKAQSNELLARSVRPIHLAHNLSEGSFATGSGSPEPRGDRMEKLALDLKTETAVFFTQPASRRATLSTKPRSQT